MHEGIAWYGGHGGHERNLGYGDKEDAENEDKVENKEDIGDMEDEVDIWNFGELEGTYDMKDIEDTEVM